MPTASKTVCLTPGCSKLVAGGRCAAHTKSTETTLMRERFKKLDRNRGSSTARGYDRTWQKARSAFLLDSPLCVSCKSKGRAVTATDVDHIVSMSKGGDRLDWDNLQALCKGCHSAKTLRE